MCSSFQLTLLLDCNGICHAAHHTTGNLSHGGNETGILFGFLLQLYVLQKRFRPHRWVFAWDSRHSFRRAIYPQYKGNRAIKRNLDDERDRQSAFRQFDLLREDILPQLGFGAWNLYQHGYEADDLIACVTEMIDGKKIIVSQDHDLYQLLTSETSIYNSRNRGLFFEEDFRMEYGIAPEQWVDVKAIAGCSGDNVEGVFRVGEATAVKYIRGELSNKSRTYAEIVIEKERIDLNRRLVRLPFEGCRKLLLEDGRLPGSGRSYMCEMGFQNVCKQYGFDSFLSEQKYQEWAALFGWK